MPRRLTNYEQETIINFNKEEKVAHIFTYNKVWQKHPENRLGLTPLHDNGYGGREYKIDKKRIKPPGVPVKLSVEAKTKGAQALEKARISATKR